MFQISSERKAKLTEPGKKMRMSVPAEPGVSLVSFFPFRKFLFLLTSPFQGFPLSLGHFFCLSRSVADGSREPFWLECENVFVFFSLFPSHISPYFLIIFSLVLMLMSISSSFSSFFLCCPQFSHSFSSPFFFRFLLIAIPSDPLGECSRVFALNFFFFAQTKRLTRFRVDYRLFSKTKKTKQSVEGDKSLSLVQGVRSNCRWR